MRFVGLGERLVFFYKAIIDLLSFPFLSFILFSYKEETSSLYPISLLVFVSQWVRWAIGAAVLVYLFRLCEGRKLGVQKICFEAVIKQMDSTVHI